MDIPRTQAAIKALTTTLTYQRPPGPGSRVGGGDFFTGLVEFGDHYLGLCTDGVGTKLLLAQALKKFDTVGLDCMAMNVNDMICAGAEPLAFVDYLALATADPDELAALGRGLNEAARQANVTIVGGESAIIPELVKENDLAGTALGVVHRDHLIDGSRIEPGDALIGLASSGPHSNGYTLIRKIVELAGTDLAEPFGDVGSTLGLTLLEPTRIYVRPIMALLKALPGKVHGLANITGGGWRNLARLNRQVTFAVSDPLPVPPIFAWLQEHGQVEAREMYGTFNMGLGFGVVTAPEAANQAVEILTQAGEQARIIGTVEQRHNGEPAVVHSSLELSWD